MEIPWRFEARVLKNHKKEFRRGNIPAGPFPIHGRNDDVHYGISLVSLPCAGSELDGLCAGLRRRGSEATDDFGLQTLRLLGIERLVTVAAVDEEDILGALAVSGNLGRHQVHAALFQRQRHLVQQARPILRRDLHDGQLSPLGGAPRHAARAFFDCRIRHSAGMPNFLCSAQIIFKVSGRLRLRIS